MNKTVAIEAFGIMLLVFMLYLTFITNFRTCEVLKEGQVVKLNCVEVTAFEK